MKRRDFLSLFIVGTASPLFAENGPLFDPPVASRQPNGLLFDPPVVDGMTEVWAYSQENCPPCELAKRSKFKTINVVWRDGPLPILEDDATKRGGRPLFVWSITTPRPKMEGSKYFRLYGFVSAEHLEAEVAKSLKKATVGQSAVPFVPSDRPNFRPVGRSKAGIYHAGHFCPTDGCGRSQFNIENDHIPTESQHSHRCSCGTVWHHSDQSRFKWWS